MTYTQSNPSKYNTFKEKIIEIVKDQYGNTRGSGMIEPICFIGVTADPLNWKSYFNASEELKTIYEKVKKGAEIKNMRCPTEEEFVSSHLAVQGLPLGMFFNEDPDMFKDPGVARSFGNFKKEMAVKEIKAMIQSINEKKDAHVCFTAFVSEVMVASTATKTIPQNLDKKAFNKYMEKIDREGGLKNLEGTEDKVIILFESEYKSDITTFDLLLNEDSEYCELINEGENMGLPKDDILNSLKNGATGRFVDLLGEKKGFSIN